MHFTNFKGHSSMRSDWRSRAAVLPVGPPSTCLIRNFRVTQTTRLVNHPSFRTRTGLKQALRQDRLKSARVETHYYSRICCFFSSGFKVRFLYKMELNWETASYFVNVFVIFLVFCCCCFVCFFSFFRFYFNSCCPSTVTTVQEVLSCKPPP